MKISYNLNECIIKGYDISNKARKKIKIMLFPLKYAMVGKINIYWLDKKSFYIICNDKETLIDLYTNILVAEKRARSIGKSFDLEVEQMISDDISDENKKIIDDYFNKLK